MSQPYPGFVEEVQPEEAHTWIAEAPGEKEVVGEKAAEFGSCMTWPVPVVGIGQPVQILQRQPSRYKAQIIVQNAGTSLIFNSKLDPLQGANPQGFTVSNAGAIPPWECQQPLYVVATGAGGIVSVYDQTFALR